MGYGDGCGVVEFVGAVVLAGGLDGGGEGVGVGVVFPFVGVGVVEVVLEGGEDVHVMAWWIFWR